jgi:hypothetical protein
MIIVAILGVGLRIGPVLFRAPRHRRLSRDMVRHHTERQAVCLKLIASEERGLKVKQNVVVVFGSFGRDPKESLRLYRKQLDYHTRMRRHWDRVTYQPWLSIRAELAYDVAQQDPELVWTTTGYGFRKALGPADY